jgi:hypothetical protein
MIEELYEGEGLNTNLKQALKRMDVNSDGKIDFLEFQELNKNFGQLLYPAFRLQKSMMRSSMGIPWWEAHKKKLVGEKQEARKKSENERIEEEKRKEAEFQKEIK